VIGFLIVASMIVEWQPVGIVISSVCYALMRFLIGEHEYQLFREWKRAKRPLEALPIVSSVDLDRQDCCVICRQKMSHTHSKRLPCHHCMDVSCLMKWAKVKRSCPICQADLTGILRSNDPYFQRFELPLTLHNRMVRNGTIGIARGKRGSPMVALRKLLDHVQEVLDERKFLVHQKNALAKMAYAEDREIADNAKFLGRCDAILADYFVALRILERMVALSDGVSMALTAAR
jgi:hypothetical protein